MSHENSYMYTLAQEERKKIQEQRARNVATRFCTECTKKYQEMINKDYASYIPGEMEQLKNDLVQVKGLAVNDPIMAQNISRDVSRYVATYDNLVEVVKHDIDEKQRAQYEIIQADLETRKKEELEKAKREIILQRIKEVEESVKAEKIENDLKKTALVTKVQALKDSVKDPNGTLNDAEEKIDELLNESDKLIIEEETRREAVRVIYKELKSQDFIVEPPKIIGSGENSVVKIVAKKPSGKSATCKVDLHGKLQYRFDNYEGMTCLKDIEKFNVDLDKIYSIKLSDERVIWENPDRILHTQQVGRLPNSKTSNLSR